MTALKLIGHFSRIDNYGRLLFTWLNEADITSDNIADCDSRDKLLKHAGNGFSPFDYVGFTVIMKRKLDVSEFVGLDCVVRVTLRNYSLRSKLEYNFGETVNGTKLILNDIVRLR